MTTPTIGIFGGHDVRETDVAYHHARAVGGVLAGLGYAVANGGYGGTMEASARGAKEAGGRTVGVTCRVWASPPNRFMDEIIQTADLFECAQRLLEVGRGGFVVLPGGTGTLVELAMAWELLATRQVPPRPLVCMTSFWRPVLELMIRQKPRLSDLVSMAESPGELGKYFPRRLDC